ncbi:DUF6531 domain-containing protein [Streptomyces gardneri]|uniref:DUF6531 domain-containing protein n=1 Tax=Streptomyces gardneri TaxID=66892 RepID=UPI00340A7D7E
MATGVMTLPQTDLTLPGTLPLVLERTHLCAYRYGQWFGRSWASTLDERIEPDPVGGGAVWARERLLAGLPAPPTAGRRGRPARRGPPHPAGPRRHARGSDHVHGHGARHRPHPLLHRQPVPGVDGVLAERADRPQRQLRDVLPPFGRRPDRRLAQRRLPGPGHGRGRPGRLPRGGRATGGRWTSCPTGATSRETSTPSSTPRGCHCASPATTPTA